VNEFYRNWLETIDKRTRELLELYPTELSAFENIAKTSDDPRMKALLNILPHIHAIRSELKKSGLFDANPR
jgi:hypothetical protein